MPVTKYFSALVCTVVATAVLSCLPGLRGQESQAHSVAPAAGPAGAAVAASRTNTFAIIRYQLAGNTVLPLELVDQCLAPAVGTSVALDEIRHALGELQLEYRNLGYRDARVVMPAQALTNGVVLLQVSEGKPIGPPPAASSTNSSAASAGGAASAGALPGTQYQVRGYTITGNSLLPVSVVERSFAGATGSAVSLQQIRRALGRLELAYRDRGYAGVRVAMPRQELADGVVRIEVVEKIPGAEEKPADRAIAGAPAAGRAEAPTNAPPVRTFEVRHYEVVGNTVLPQRVIEQSFTNAIGPKVSMEMIRQGLSRLQLAYRERGFATVAVGLPQQQLTNATITVKVTEGKLAQIRVTGNNFFSSNNVLRALPSLHTNILPNSHVLQRELDVANVNRDRQIYPTVGPGPDPGTSELTLKVKDRLPLHGRAEVDNYSTPGTPDLRVNVAAQYNNLWQREQQIGVSYGFTPDDYKPQGVVPDYFFNRPLISYYGAYYRIPFGSASSVQDTINNSVGQFGYNEATHEFQLPPAGARPDFTVFASGSSSSTGVKLAPATVVAQTPLLTILSQDSGQDVTINEDLGGRLSIPLTVSDRTRFSFSGGADFKNYKQESYNTNNFLITTIVTNSQGSQIIQSKVTAPQDPRINQVQYIPLTLAADFSESDKTGNTYANVSGLANFTGARKDFVALAGSRKASAVFGKANLTLSREQKVYRDWSLLFRANGQTASGPLISNEQYPLGGINSVRGYYEGDEYGDSGWFISAEARTPLLATRVSSVSDFVPLWLRASVFVDYGQCYLLQTGGKIKQPDALWGAGFGVSANINNHFDIRVAVGWPLLDSLNSQAGVPRAYFTVGGQF